MYLLLTAFRSSLQKYLKEDVLVYYDSKVDIKIKIEEHVGCKKFCQIEDVDENIAGPHHVKHL